MYAGTAAVAAAGATGGSGLWLFSYNKENFGFDAGMRFGRFMMARGFANAQVGQYREDIEGITGMTVTKMDAWQSVTTLFLAVAAALSCAGRIGMHGAAPPGWFCALYSGSIFASVLFNGLSLWLSMHASLRAQCAAVSLQTRKVRLPIPSTAQLDQARVFGSSFEKQEARDIFRIPFMQHPENAPESAAASSDGKDKKGAKGKKGKNAKSGSQEDFGSTSRQSVPSWIRDEVAVDKADGSLNEGEADDLHEALDAPDHFNLLMEAQKEWRDYDVYARISMLYGVISFLYAVTYYAVGTAICELRGFWVMWSLPLVFVVAQALILRLDILQNTNNSKLPYAEWLGHIAPYFAVAACTLEYRYYYSTAQVAITWGLVLVTFFGHFMMGLRMLDLAWPSVSNFGDMPEEPAKQWWPSEWAVPKGFAKNLWFITPPKQLQEGQSCLMHEMEDLAATGGGLSKGKAPKKGSAKKGQKSAAAEAATQELAPTIFTPLGDINFKRTHELPWHLTRVAILTVCFMWFFMMIASGVEIILGPESLLKPPGEPPWIRDTKVRSWVEGSGIHLSTSDSLPEGYRLFAASKARYTEGEAGGEHSDTEHSDAEHSDAEHSDAEHSDAEHSDAEHSDAEHSDATHSDEGHSDSEHRRLSDKNGSFMAFGDLLKVVPALEELLELVVEKPKGEEILARGDVAASSNFMAPELRAESVAWPPLFEPHHLACKPGAREVLAITRRGFAALAPLASGASTQAEPFALDGLAGHGAIVGSTWTPEGLLLATASGVMLRCAGEGPQEGIWACAEAGRLPLPANSELAAAGLENGIVAAVFKHLPRSAILFKGGAEEWHPAGEVHVPPEIVGSFSLSFAGNGDSLLITARSGEVHQRHVANGRGASILHSAPLGFDAAAHEFRATCADREGSGLLRLALKENNTGGAAAWAPRLIAATAM